MLFVHEMGYTFLTVNQLTYAEINMLMDAWNQKQKDERDNVQKSKKK